MTRVQRFMAEDGVIPGDVGFLMRVWYATLTSAWCRPREFVLARNCQKLPEIARTDGDLA